MTQTLYVRTLIRKHFCKLLFLFFHTATRDPFLLHFRSDKWETAPEAQIGGQNANNGFRLVYTMDGMVCNPAGI
jgi:hypothetical protein